MRFRILETSYLILAFSLLTVALAREPASAQVPERESLKGLNGVLLVVEDLHQDARTIDLTRQSIVNLIESRLSDAGIPILSIQERLADPRKPYLYVNCNVMFVPDVELATFSVDVETHQLVTLKTGEDVVALTWAKSYLGVRGKEKAAQKIRDVIAQLIDQFVADFLAVNDPPARGSRSTV